MAQLQGVPSRNIFTRAAAPFRVWAKRKGPENTPQPDGKRQHAPTAAISYGKANLLSPCRIACSVENLEAISDGLHPKSDGLHLRAMASTLEAMASNLVAMASTLEAMWKTLKHLEAIINDLQG